MSRYDVKAIHADRYRVIVGWDNPLQTLFGQIWDRSREEEEACIF